MRSEEPDQNFDEKVSVEYIIDRTILHTESLLSNSLTTWAAARAGAIKIMRNLSAERPQDEALIKSRLGSWLLQNDLMDLALSRNPCAIRQTRRIHPRVMAVGAVTFIQSEDGQEAQAELLDYSVSGARLQTKLAPQIGSIVLIGSVRAKIVRHTPEGVACAFETILPALQLNDLTAYPRGNSSPISR